MGLSQPKAYDARLFVMAMLKCSGLSVKLQAGSCLGDLKHKPRCELKAAPAEGTCSQQSRGVMLVGEHKSREQIREMKMYQKSNCNVRSIRGCWFVVVCVCLFLI